MTSLLQKMEEKIILKNQSFYPLSNPALYAIILLIFIGGCGNSGSKTQKETQKPEQKGPKTSIVLTGQQMANIGVETVPVAVHTTGMSVELPGKVVPQPDQEAYVTSLIAGRVERVMVNEGDHISKGQVLATVSGSQLGTLIANLQNTRLEFNRQKRLMDRGVGIEKQLQDARIFYTSAQQQLRAIGFGADEIEKMATGDQIIDAMPLRSPVDGVVLERMAVTGGPVAGGDKLFYIVNLQPVWVQADAYEKDLRKIKTGQSAIVTTAVYPDTAFPGSIKNIIPKINTGNRTASVIIELPNQKEELKPGMFATVKVLTNALEQLAVPAQAIQVEGDSTFVLVAVNDTTFKKVSVSAPPDGVNYVAVPDLAKGTKVVTKGAFQIISAMKGIQADDE